MDAIPQIIKDVGFDFHWSEEKVWGLTDIPTAEMEISELMWHFDIPFLDEQGARYNLTPREVMEHPEQHPDEYARTQGADMKWPVDIMENKGKWLLLDGLHRLMKAYMTGQKKVRVRTIPRERMSDIIR